MNEDDASSYVSDLAGVECRVIRNNGDVLPESMLQPGDIILMFEGSYYYHSAIYIGDGEYGESGRYDGPNSLVRISKYSPEGTGTKIAIRYVGPGGGGGGGFSAKSEMTVLETIDNNTGTRKSIPRSGKYCVAQSFAYLGNSRFGVAMTTGPTTGTTGLAYLTDKDGSIVDTSSGNIYHANGATCTEDGKLIISGFLNGRENLGLAFDITGDKISNIGEVSFATGSSGIARDRDTGNYITRKGTSITVYDSSRTKEITSFTETHHGAYFQDIGAGGGYIFASHCISKGGENSGENYIDIYEEKSGTYCGSYNVNYGELESADVVDGELVLLIHIKGSGTNYLHFTGIRVSSIASGGSGGTVTKSDMDILAAYSISLANSSLWYDKEEGEGSENDFGFFSNRYRDLNGKRIKTFRFGDDTGKIDYVSDLKSKVDDWTFYRAQDREYSFNGTQVHVTIKESPAHKICNNMFKVKPYAEYVNSMAKPRPLTDEEKAEADQAEDEIKESETLPNLDTSKVDKSEWNLLLVNPDKAIPDGYSPSLADIESGKPVDERIVEPLQKMLDACKNAGHSPKIISWYRDAATQQALYDAETDKSLTAKVGHSEHQTGLAVDIVYSGDSNNLTDSQADNATQQWLMSNCHEYGFILRYPKNKTETTKTGYEPWHYRYVGKDHAEKIMKYGICLEEYLSGNIFKAPEEFEEDAPELLPGKTTNAEAIYSLSRNTIELLFTGLADRQAGTFGNSDFPLPLDSSWAWTSGFGPRWGTNHNGMDFGAPKGTDIYSTFDGNVTTAGQYGGYGLAVVVNSEDKTIVYGHMSKITATTGPVRKGQKIGEVGSTGRSTGNHLHYEIRVNGNPVDPYDFFKPEIQAKIKSKKAFGAGN